MGTHPTARNLISWLAIGMAGLVVITTAISSAAYPTAEAAPGQFDWVNFVANVIFLAVPLVLVGLGLRSPRRGVARATALLALVLAALLTVTLLGHAFWGHDWVGYAIGAKVLDVLGGGPPALVCLAAFLVELPSFTRTWPRSISSA